MSCARVMKLWSELYSSSSSDWFTTVTPRILFCHIADTRKIHGKQGKQKGDQPRSHLSNGRQLRHPLFTRHIDLHQSTSTTPVAPRRNLFSHANSNQSAGRFHPLEVDSSIVISHNSANPCFFDPASEIHTLVRGELIFKFQLRLIYLQGG